MRNVFKFRRLTFRIWLPFALLMTALAIVTGLYFPSRQADAIRNYRGQELAELSRSLALSLEIALLNEDLSALARVVDHARSHDDLDLMAVVEQPDSGSANVFLTYPETLEVDVLALADETYLIRRMPFETPALKGEVVVALSYAYINQEVAVLNLPLYVTMFGLILVALVLAVPVARLVSRPIEELTDIAGRLQAGEYGTPLPVVSRRDEIRTLYHALDSLRVALQDQKERNDDINRNLSRLVDERTAELDRLSLVARTTDNGVIITDVNQTITWLNEAMCRMSGYDREEILGNTPRMFQFEGTSAETRRSIRESLRAHRPIQAEIQNRRKDGSPYWVMLFIQPIMDRLGKHQGYMSVEVDTTERKRYEMELLAAMREVEASRSQSELLNEELNKTVEELVQTNSELDRFVYSTSHDLRAPMLSVIGIVDLCKETFYPDDEAFQEMLGMMRQALKRGDEVIRSILEYSRNRRLGLHPEVVRVNDVVRNHLRSIEFLAGIQDVRFEFEIGVEDTLVTDRFRFESIVNNLVTNAVKYQRAEEPSKFVRIRFRRQIGGGVFEVEDNGEGVPEDRLKAIFEMFVRNSVSSTGSGLGLYITRDLVKRLGGELHVESTVGIGSRFSVSIPDLDLAG